MALDAPATAPLEGDERAPRSRTVLFVAGLIMVVMLAFIWTLATSEPATDRRVDSPLTGKVVPTVAGNTIAGGTFDIDRERGRFVIVNFFATWCLPCQQEHPELAAFQRGHAATGDATIVSVIFDDQLDQVREFFDERGGDWPVVIDPDDRMALDFGVGRVPESYVITPDGVVAAKIVGGVTAAGLERLLTEIRTGAA